MFQTPAYGGCPGPAPLGEVPGDVRSAALIHPGWCPGLVDCGSDLALPLGRGRWERRFSAQPCAQEAWLRLPGPHCGRDCTQGPDSCEALSLGGRCAKLLTSAASLSYSFTMTSWSPSPQFIKKGNWATERGISPVSPGSS